MVAINQTVIEKQHQETLMLVERDHISLRSGKGVIGDRNYGVNSHAGQNLTLVEAEEIEHFCSQSARSLDLSLTRRNLVTRGVKLNELLNVEFTIGTVRLRGVELCEPCVLIGRAMSTESLAPAAVIKHWLGRGGLRVDVLTNGDIALGDAIKTNPSGPCR